MTKKQKEERAMAELRKQALLASGVQIEGLQQSQSGGSGPKKVVYGNKKKNAKKDNATDSRPRTPEPEPEPESPAKEESANGAAADDWDASSEDEKPAETKAEGVKDDWDASSEDEDAKPPPPKKETAAKGKSYSMSLRIYI